MNTYIYRSTSEIERWKDRGKEGWIYRMRRGLVGVKSSRVWPPGSRERDSEREREGATAKSKIKVGLDQCHYCKITSESVRERHTESMLPI